MGVILMVTYDPSRITYQVLASKLPSLGIAVSLSTGLERAGIPRQRQSAGSDVGLNEVSRVQQTQLRAVRIDSNVRASGVRRRTVGVGSTGV